MHSTTKKSRFNLLCRCSPSPRSPVTVMTVLEMSIVMEIHRMVDLLHERYRWLQEPVAVPADA